MILTKKHLDRRTMLKGMGVTMALPLLEAMVPARAARAQSTAGRVRFIAIEVPHGSAGSTAYGIKTNMWAPAGVGRDFDLSQTILSPLEQYKQDLTIVSNADCRNAEAFAPPEIGGDHFRSAAVFLTQSHPKQTQGSDLYAGTSIDQLYAKRFGQDMGDAKTDDVVAKTPNAAIKKPDASGKSTNVLEVRVGADKVDYVVNGTVVGSSPKTGLATDGMWGARVNHLLDVNIDDIGTGK